MINFPIKKINNRLSSPVNGIDNLRREIDSFLELSFPNTLGHWPGVSRENLFPRMDVIDKKNQILVNLDLPGVDKKDLNVTLENNRLVISGERKEDKHIIDDNYYFSERVFGQFRRSVELPVNVDVNKIKANFRNGVLNLILTKKEECVPKRIDINIDT